MTEKLDTSWRMRSGDLLFCGLVALIFITINSTCSPLYAFNDWVDPNCFMTMGKGMLKGLVPYRDLFEQKGPLLYLLHALAYLADRTGFLGVYILEVVNMAAVLLLGSRIMRIFAARRWQWFILPLFACLTLVSSSFESGDLAEEFAMPLIMGMLLIMARHFKERPDQPLRFGQALTIGLLGGCVLMIKYTLLGYWLGFALAFVLACLINRQVRGLFANAAGVLAGVALALLPWLIYFGLNDAVDDFVGTYFLINMTLYAQDLNLSDTVRLIAGSVTNGVARNWIAGTFSLLGVLVFTISRRRFASWPGRLALPLCGACQILGAYGGGKNYGYYYFAFFPFLIFGLTALACLLEKRRQPQLKPAIKNGLAAVWLVLLTFAAISNGPNIPQMNNTREQYPQYAFAEIINQTEGATLLNYGFLDGGFYTAADITPSVKYFMLNNLSYEQLPEMWTEMDRAVQTGAVDFVVLRLNRDTNAATAGPAALRTGYTLVAEQLLPYRGNEGLVFKYALYKLKSD